MRIFLFIIFSINASFSFAQGANNKFLQLRDFTAGMNPNGVYFVDEQRNTGIEGSSYLFEKFVPSVLITTDSNAYYLDQTNISLISNSFEIINKNQSFFFDKNLVSRIDFQISEDKTVAIEYSAVLDKYVQVLFSDEIKLVKTHLLEVKKPDYRADLNVGSKNASYNTEELYYLITTHNSAFAFDSKKDAKLFLSNNFPDLKMKGILKKLSFRKEVDLIDAARVINDL